MNHIIILIVIDRILCQAAHVHVSAMNRVVKLRSVSLVAVIINPN